MINSLKFHCWLTISGIPKELILKPILFHVFISNLDDGREWTFLHQIGELLIAWRTGLPFRPIWTRWPPKALSKL